MKSAHSLEPYRDEHAPLMAALIFDGVDVNPVADADRFIGYGQTSQGYGPLCIVDLAGTSYVAEPHVIWFPWASKSMRVLGFKWVMEYLAAGREVMLTVQKDQTPFFEHFVKTGLLRKVGHLEDMPIVEEVHIYQYRRRK